MDRTEFYEVAVRQGYYGNEKFSLYGKKDNVRRFWEDIFVKLALQPEMEALLREHEQLRVVDLGCGSGEGIELLLHIPFAASTHAEARSFLLDWEHIETYDGVDLSPAMVSQGQKNYADRNNVRFSTADLSEGFPLRNEKPYHLYLSTYAALSHLMESELESLLCDILRHADGHAYVLMDVFGRWSPEWPCYWSGSSAEPKPYNMAYLHDASGNGQEPIESFNVSYWTGADLERVVCNAVAKTGVPARVRAMKDRSILVGRHMATAFFKDSQRQYRYQVNRLFDRDYRGETEGLRVDLEYLQPFAEVAPRGYARILEYAEKWQAVVDTMTALMRQDRDSVKRLIESVDAKLSDELKMLAWIFRNADRFPVVDFWASVMGPQVACVLRNLEMSLPDGLGCGHSLLCLLELNGDANVSNCTTE